VLTLPRDLCRSPTGLLQGRKLSLWRFYNTKRKRKSPVAILNKSASEFFIRLEVRGCSHFESEPFIRTGSEPLLRAHHCRTHHCFEEKKNLQKVVDELDVNIQSYGMKSYSESVHLSTIACTSPTVQSDLSRRIK
jgi:hypothetical protein